jgi:hypothetical protein
MAPIMVPIMRNQPLAQRRSGAYRTGQLRRSLGGPWQLPVSAAASVYPRQGPGRRGDGARTGVTSLRAGDRVLAMVEQVGYAEARSPPPGAGSRSTTPAISKVAGHRIRPNMS